MGGEPMMKGVQLLKAEKKCASSGGARPVPKGRLRTRVNEHCGRQGPMIAPLPKRYNSMHVVSQRTSHGEALHVCRRAICSISRHSSMGKRGLRRKSIGVPTFACGTKSKHCLCFCCQ